MFTDALLNQIRENFKWAWMQIREQDKEIKQEGWGYWFATCHLCDSLGMSDEMQRELGR